MEAVMLVEALDVHGHVLWRQRMVGVGAQCRIGRALGCDLVLDDAYAAPEHALLTLQPDGRVLVQDLATRNGTRLGGRRVDARAGALVDVAELVIGRTRVRVRTAAAPLAPERIFRRDLLQRHRTLLAVAGLMLCFAFAGLLQWSYAPARLAQRVLVAELAALAGLAVWVGAWSLVSRLTVGAWQVRVHLALAALCVAVWAWGYALHSVAAFALQWRWLGPLAALAAAAVALAAAYQHLRHATHLRRATSLALAALAPLLLGGVLWLAELQFDPRTVNRVQQGPRVYPPAWRVAPSVDAADYLADAADLKREANRNRQESLRETPILDSAQ